MYRAMQAGWLPPENVSEELYRELETAPDTDPRKAFAGFGCSWGGKWFGGYARGCPGRNYATNAHNSLLRKWPGMSGASFVCDTYENIIPVPGAVVYCDPPYKDTTRFSAPGDFDTAMFWDWCRQRSKTCCVLVSEWAAPAEYCELVLEVSARRDMRAQDPAPRTERLFLVHP